jgi:flagellar L-ring protein precursor FlgH
MQKNIISGKTALPLSAALAALLLGGCNGAGSMPSPAMPVTPPQAYTEPEQRYENPGSLFSDSASSTMLFADNRARNVGDIVLVKIVETSKAKSKADTSAERKASNEVGVTAAFGRSRILNGKVGADVGPILGTTTNTKNDATGETTRENYVTATIGARVIQVMPNGLMQVAGSRTIKVNDETQYMVVSGLLRSSDVAADNSVLSTQLSDSTIEYGGKGSLADKQRSGWLTRLVDNLWPF